MVVVAKDNNVQIEKLELKLQFPGAEVMVNTYILTCLETRESVLIDAPGEAAKLIESLKGTSPKYVLITHNHIDHTGALAELKSALGVKIAAHQLDAAGLPLPPDVALNDGDIVSFGKVQLKVIHTPGHSPGGLCFLTNKYLLAGDTIFPGGPGATRTPDALRQIIESITKKIFILPDDIQVFSGHGEATVLKKEKEEFAIFSSKPHDPALCGDVLWLSA